MKPFLCAQFLSNPCCTHLSARPFVNGLVGGLFLRRCGACEVMPSNSTVVWRGVAKGLCGWRSQTHTHTHIYIYVYIYNTYCIYLRIIMIIRVSLRWDTQNAENPQISLKQTHTYLPTCLLAYLPHLTLPTHLPACMQACMHTYMHAYAHAHTDIPT